MYSAERPGSEKTTTRGKEDGQFSREEEFEGPAMNKKRQGVGGSGRSRIGTTHSSSSTRLRGCSETRKCGGKGLTIEEDPELGVIVKGLTQIEVNSAEEIFAILARSSSNRLTAEASSMEDTPWWLSYGSKRSILPEIWRVELTQRQQ